MLDYYASTAFDHYRRQDDLKRISNLITELDINLPINPIEKPQTDIEIEMQLAGKGNNAEK